MNYQELEERGVKLSEHRRRTLFLLHVYFTLFFGLQHLIISFFLLRLSWFKVFFSIKQNIFGQFVFRSTRRPSNSFFKNLLYIHNIIQTLVLKFPSNLILFLVLSFLFPFCAASEHRRVCVCLSARFPRCSSRFLSTLHSSRPHDRCAAELPARRREEVRTLLVYILTDNEWNLRYSTKQKGQRRGRESKTDQQHRFSLRNDTRVALPAVLLFDMLEVRELGRRDLHAHVRHGLAAPLDGWTQSIPGEREHMKKVHLSAKRGRKIWKWENELIKILIGD